MRKKPTGYSSTTPVSTVSDAVASEMNSAGTTAYTYDHRGRRKTVDAPNTTAADGSLLANVTNTLYFPDGSVQETNGDQTYRTAYTYDYAARTKTMATYRISGLADTTTWNYESWSGRLSSKLDAALQGPSLHLHLRGPSPNPHLGARLPHPLRLRERATHGHALLHQRRLRHG